MGFDIEKETGQYLICHCPNHPDNVPSLFINKVHHNGKSIGFWYCFSCQAQGQITEEEVLAISKKRAKGGTKRGTAPINWLELWATTISNAVLESWETHDALAKSWNVAPIVTDWFGMGRLEGWYSFPFYNADMKPCGVQLRNLEGKKLCVEGSKLGLFMHSHRPYEPVVVTEGVSDACVSLHRGYYTIGKPNCSVGNNLVKDFLESAGYKGSIIICADADPSGIRGAEELKRVLDVHNVKIVYPPNPYKDLRNFHQAGGDVKGFIDG